MDAQVDSPDVQRRHLLTRALSPSRPLRIADVGANPTSEPPYWGLVQDGVAHVYGFEPNEEAFAELEQNKGAHETYFCQAIGAPGKRTLYLHANSGLTSLFPMDRRSLSQVGAQRFANAAIEEVTVQTVNLDDLAGLPKLDLLKMDLQGGELEVLQGGTNCLSDALVVVPEVRFHRIYEGEPMFGDIDVALRAMGFRFHKFLYTSEIVRPSTRSKTFKPWSIRSQMWDGDAVYLRDMDFDTELSDDQLIHLLFLSETVLESRDLTLYLLDMAVTRALAPAEIVAAYIALLPAKGRKDV